MSVVAVALQVLPHGQGLPLPAYASAGAAGVDLAAAVAAPLALAPGARAAVPTGIALALPEGYEAQIRPRSGLALQHGLTVLNSPGTIDADYRGELRVILANLGGETVTILRGQRIAQLVVAAVTRVAFERMASLPETGRGAGGFGSTGR
jgi:dUTP pyrophosphatase